MKRLQACILLLGVFGVSLGYTQGGPGPDGKFHYQHQLRANPSRAASPLPDQDFGLIQDTFARAYQKAKKPRMLFLLNERLMEGIEDPFELDSKVETSVRAQGTLPVGSPQQNGLVNVQVNSNNVPSNPVAELDGEVTASTKTYRKKVSESPAPHLDALAQRELETLFTEPFLDAGALIVEKDMLLDTDLSHLVPRLLSHKEGEQPAAKMRAVLDKSDLVVECLLFWRPQRVMRATGDVEVEVPYGAVRIVDLKTAQVVARTASRSLIDPNAVVTAKNMGADVEAQYLQALAYDTMAKLARRWNPSTR